MAESVHVQPVCQTRRADAHGIVAGCEPHLAVSRNEAAERVEDFERPYALFLCAETEAQRLMVTRARDHEAADHVLEKVRVGRLVRWRIDEFDIHAQCVVTRGFRPGKHPAGGALDEVPRT